MTTTAPITAESLTATNIDTPAKTEREHIAAGNALRVMHADAKALDKKLCDHFDAWHAHMDPEDRDYLGEKMNDLHDLVTALEFRVRDHDRAARQATWTAQDWAEHALVTANID